MNRPEFALRDLSTRDAVPALLPDAAGDCRCVCGALLTRWLPLGLELKCRRCKRALVVPWRDLAGQKGAGDPQPQASGDCRCLCGSLLARWLDTGLELKCRRCKRVPVLSWQLLGQAPRTAATSSRPQER